MPAFFSAGSSEVIAASLDNFTILLMSQTSTLPVWTEPLLTYFVSVSQKHGRATLNPTNFWLNRNIPHYGRKLYSCIDCVEGHHALCHIFSSSTFCLSTNIFKTQPSYHVALRLNIKCAELIFLPVALQQIETG